VAPQLSRFRDAQDQAVSGFESALSEIRQGRKRSHWIWYVFPQLSGLGQSPASITYGLHGIAEATEYLRDPILRSRLLTIAAAVAEQVGHPGTVSLSQLMGSAIDVTKLVSSMTLFGNLAKRLTGAEPAADFVAIGRVADEILRVARAEGYPPCQFTIDQLG
jgi:uncharacterized protein (DUF1810 family)